MTSKCRAFALTAVLALAAGCGNYSNEDLEFMNAVPDTGNLSANLVDATSPANEAELARDTHDTVKTFNGILNTVLGGVEAIRVYQPTGRTPDSRTWGPIPDTDHPGWQWEFVMVRQDDGSFDYRFEFELLGATDAWLTFITGNFIPAAGVHRGVGSFTLDTGPLRGAGFPFDVGLGKIDTLTVSYQTKDFPISVIMDLVTFPNYPTEITTTNAAHYEFGAQADGSGAMKFSLSGDLIPVTPAMEVVQVTSRWLASGAGRGDLTVLSGDDAGAMETQCWNTSFVATYSDKPWGTAAENLGDPSLCPAISSL